MGFQVACVRTSSLGLSSHLSGQLCVDVHRLTVSCVAPRPSHICRCRGNAESQRRSTTAQPRTAVPQPSASQPGPSVLGLSRREMGISLAAVCLAGVTFSAEKAMAAVAIVGEYLPKAASDGFVVYTAGPKDTPGLRAGIVRPYGFDLPATWKEAKVANIASGNYCQPRCAEPWTEVRFEEPKQGRCEVLVSPLVRLTNDPDATIDQLGTPDSIINRLGQFVTGNFLETEDIVEMGVSTKEDQMYYTYEVNAPYARTGSHNLVSITVKKGAAYLFVVSADEKQWTTSAKVLRSVRDSFRV